MYIFVLSGNLTRLFVIAFHRHFHKPMYMLLCNMIICDLIGSTALMPRLMYGYFAICNPLRYHGVVFVLLFILFSLILRLPRCRSIIVHTYCFNGALYLLSCVDTTVNNIYG
ncbi:olfactory receptor 52D1-like [Erpetoichthys calabaricus]|uniref:olfactory receptor 52D1-like n=1 Tax=Erpetoichthys calabaricus TaxID=27687 RepID=UPI0022348D2E|nr:olfactory receptor 52D1-like [Erpetoichthys calabaricus]